MRTSLYVAKPFESPKIDRYICSKFSRQPVENLAFLAGTDIFIARKDILKKNEK